MSTGLKYNDLFPSRYLKATDIGDNDLALTIERVEIEELNGGNGKELKPCVYFREVTKCLVLNKVNGETIAKIYGEDIDAWSGKRITLYTTEVQFGGKTSMGIRVRMRPPQITTRPPAPQDNMPPEPDIPEPFPDF